MTDRHTADTITSDALDRLYARAERAETEARRLREIEAAAVHARSALAALCYDLEDPGIDAIGALYLLQRATLTVDAPKDDAALALARHDARVMRRCADFVRDTYPDEWADDAAATLDRDAEITERGCSKERQADSLTNCQNCGMPWGKHPVAAGPVEA